MIIIAENQRLRINPDSRHTWNWKLATPVAACISRYIFEKFIFGKMFTNCTPLEISTKYSKLLHFQPANKIFSKNIKIHFWQNYFWKNVHKLHSVRNFDEIFEISSFSAREQNIFRKYQDIFLKNLFLEKCSQIAPR